MCQSKNNVFIKAIYESPRRIVIQCLCFLSDRQADKGHCPYVIYTVCCANLDINCVCFEPENFLGCNCLQMSKRNH